MTRSIINALTLLAFLLWGSVLVKITGAVSISYLTFQAVVIPLILLPFCAVALLFCLFIACMTLDALTSIV